MLKNLKKGQIFDNDDLYDIFKCANSGGMRKSNSTNSLLIISVHTQPLYDDKWDQGILYYTGMGQFGDQDINFRQNKTLNESNKNNVNLFLFEVFTPKEYIYMGKVKLIDKPFKEKQYDRDKKLRDAWIFPLKLEENNIPVDNKLLEDLNIKRAKKIQDLSDEEIKKGVEFGKEKPGSRKSFVTNYERNLHVVEYAKRRAGGICQLCKFPAPFHNKKGEPYLEVHHIDWLSQEGADTINNVVALCPNCHRKMHILNLKEDIEKLKKAVNQIN